MNIQRERSTVHSPEPERQPDLPMVGRYVLQQNRNPPERYGTVTVCLKIRTEEVLCMFNYVLHFI